MRRWLKRIGLAVLAAVIVFGAVFYYRVIRLPNPQVASAAGQVAPDFTLPDQNGQPVHLAELRGQPVLLMFYRGYW